MMLYTKIQPWNFLGSAEDDFYVFLSYMGIRRPWLKDHDYLNKFLIPSLTEGSTWSLKKIGLGLTEEKSFKGMNGRRTDDNRR